MVQKQPPEVFCKKGALRNFAKFTGKHLCQSLFFNKVAGLRPATLLKRRLWHSRFPVNFAKFLTPPFLTEHLRQLLLLLHFLSSLLGLCYLFIQEKVQTYTKGETLRSRRSQMFFKIAVLKDFAITVKKHLYLSVFLISLQAHTPAFLLKRESTTGVFLINF